MIDINLGVALDLMAEAVAEKGEDYVYSSGDSRNCAYVHGYKTIEQPNEYGQDESVTVQDGPLTPGCLVGNVLHRAGIPLELFEELGINEDCPADEALSRLAEQGHLKYTTEAMYALLGAQQLQDRNNTWGVALKNAEEQ